MTHIQRMAFSVGTAGLLKATTVRLTHSQHHRTKPVDEFDDEAHHHDAPQAQRHHATHSAAHHGSHHGAQQGSHHHHPASSHHDVKPVHLKQAKLPVTVLDAKGNPVQITPVERFEDVPDMPKWLALGLEKLGYPTTTDIQGITIPPLLDGHDMIGLAPTGSGKTVAFAVPALKLLKRSPHGNPTILVLAPTRELVQQTAKVFMALGGSSIHVCEAYGGTPREIQARKLSRGCDVLVACPGRLKDFLDSGVVVLDDLSFLVFDEADRLLDMGFKIQLDEIMNFVNPRSPRQSMMWSATWPVAVQRLAAEYMSADRYMIRAGNAGTGAQVNDRIRQHIFIAEDNIEKVELLCKMIEDGTIKEEECKMMIFVERQSDTDEVASRIARRLGVRSNNIASLHGGMPQKRRDYVMQNFKENRCRILVATDVASRGLDFPDVTAVVNFSAPKDIDSYCHRIGRTGRAGREGDAFTFLEPSNTGLAKDIVAFMEKCKLVAPQEVKDLASRHRGSSGGYDRFGGNQRRGGFQRGRGGGNRGSFSRGYGGGGGGGYGREQYGGRNDSGFDMSF